MNVLLFGASGMVGRGVLLECLDHPQVKSVTAVVRRPLEDQHPKLKQVEHQDFENFELLRSEFQDIDACFYCMGVFRIEYERIFHRRDQRPWTDCIRRP